MNRQVIEALEDLAKYYAKAPKARYQMALIVAIDALKSPQPDPDTGLVPCGCGGKAMLMTIEGCVVGAVCGSCGVGTQADENAVMAWNTAMGWKGDAE